MAEFVGVGIEVGKLIAGPIKRQFKYLCCFNTNIQNLRDEAKKLGEAKEGVEGRVDAARRNVQVILPQVETWLHNVNMIQADMRGIETDEIPNVKSGCLGIKSRFLLSRKATKMAAAIKELQNAGKFEQICHPPPPPAMASSIPVGQTFELETRKHLEDEIMATLRDKKANMMGICGMGGVGKTTMAKNIMSRAKGESLFEEIMMAVVSQPVDMFRIQNDMAESLGLKLGVESLAARANLLRARLMSTKSILIILDDVWKKLNLEELGIPYQKECTILLTSRNMDVFSAMSVEKPYQFQMKILSDIEALSLFKEKVGACADDPRLSPIAEKIVRECQGLPIALVTVGLALKDNENIAIWENAVRELTSCNPEGIPDFIAQVYKPLRLSYDSLENNEHAKSIFLLCCLYPEDREISISKLGLYAWGLGLLEGTSMRAARNKVQASVETLKSRSLLLDEGNARFTKMHDVVRDVGIFIGKKEELMNPSNWPREADNCTWISLFNAQKITLPQGSAFPKLQFLLIEELHSSPKEELPLGDNFFESVENLHVLSIQNYALGSLPHTINMLKNLRSLILVWCSSLEDISVVGELVSLEILYCQYCYSIKELPVEIGRLKQLKLLNIEECYNLKTIAAGVISRLISLEELTLIRCFTKWESGASQGKKNAALCELNYLSSLTTLRIQIEDASLAAEQINLPNLVEFTIDFFPVFYGQTRLKGREMRLYLERDDIIGDWIYQLLPKSQSLRLRGEGSSKLVPLSPELNQSLTTLTISNSAKMTRLIDGRSSGPTTTVFPLLEVLWLEEIDDLEEIHRGPISSHSFKNLSYIYILNCHSLRSLFPWAMGNDSLLQLEFLIVESCSMLEVMWDEEDGKEIGQSSRNHCHTTFPNLKQVFLDDLPRLTTLCKGIDSAEFPALTQMKIKKCPNLKTLVSGHRKCRDDDSLHLFCKSHQVAFGMLEELEIRGYGSISSLWCDGIPIDFFTGLVDLTISDCGNIKSIFSLSIAKNLVNLKKLSIGSCPEMVRVVKDEVDEVERSPFIKLEELELVALPKLNAFCDWSCALHLPSLRKVSILECPEMERFLSGNLTSSISSDSFKNLETIKIFNCSMLEQVMLWNEEENGESSRITFPKLENLSLRDLPRLTSFCKGIQSIEYPLLNGMRIVKCPNLKSLVSSAENDKKCSGAINLDADDSLHLFCKSKVSFDWLVIDGYDGISSLWCNGIPNDFFFTGLVHLTVSNCGNINNLFSLSIAKNLVHLEKLSIQSCSEMVRVVEVDEVERSPFIKLEELELKALPKLKAFCDWSCALHLPSLRKVSILECPEMERFLSGNLTSSISSDSFKNLETIKISHCSILEQVMSWNEEENGESSRITFPKLIKLSLRDLPRLTSFCKGIQSIEFPLLSKMKIVECPNLKSLATSTENDHVCSGAVNHDVDDSLHLFCKSEVAFGRLEELTIDGYTNTSSESSWSLWCDQIPVDFFIGLVDLEVSNCGNIKSLFSPSVARNLVNLIRLTIKSCCEMVKVIEDEDEVERSPFIKLEVLTLEKLPNLKAFCDWRCALQFPSLEEVSIDECLEMERFSFGSLTTPNLERISKNRQRFGNLQSCFPSS